MHARGVYEFEGGFAGGGLWHWCNSAKMAARDEAWIEHLAEQSAFDVHIYIRQACALMPVLRANHARVMPTMAFVAWIQKSAQNQNGCLRRSSLDAATMARDSVLLEV